MPDDGLSQAEREVIAVGASVGAGCRPCTRQHLRAAREAGAALPTIREAIDDALRARRRAADDIASFAEEVIGRTQAAAAPPREDGALLHELVSLAAALAVNCPTTLGHHLRAAQRLGATDRQVAVALGLARAVKKAAAEHAEAAARLPAAEDRFSAEGPERCGPGIEKIATSAVGAAGSAGCGCATGSSAGAT